jgi:hypothetical protein
MGASSYYFYSKSGGTCCRAGVVWKRRQDGNLCGAGVGGCYLPVGFVAGREALNRLLPTSLGPGTLRGRVDALTGVDGANPVTKPGDCVGSKPTAKLIACLQPDRRVDVEVTGTK